MTREERHIAVLSRLLENMDVYDSVQPTEERKKAIKAAIKALSQQPCEDAIRREDEKVISLERAKKQIGRWIGYIDQDMINRICMSLDALPPVTHGAKDDFIYALKTCEYTVHNGQVMYAEEDLIKRFDELPSVTPSRHKGRWIIKDRYYHDTVTAECSVCGREVEIPTCMSELMYKGCPYCLAEMVEPQEW